ncbi:hypothetical protein [Dapis sp. BLCC M172]
MNWNKGNTAKRLKDAPLPTNKGIKPSISKEKAVVLLRDMKNAGCAER